MIGVPNPLLIKILRKNSQPNATMSGTMPNMNAIKKIRLLFLPNAIAPHSPCEIVSIVFVLYRNFENKKTGAPPKGNALMLCRTGCFSLQNNLLYPPCKATYILYWFSKYTQYAFNGFGFIST